MTKATLPRPRRIARAGSLTVFITFDTGTKVADTPGIWDAIKNAVADVTGATDVTVANRGAALIMDSVVAA
jgi:hypothetical protein